MFPNSQSGQQCFQTADEFETYCKTTYNGTTNGGRCFFLLPSLYNWTDAWIGCGNLGGTLAQIHTSNEFAEMINYTVYIHLTYALTLTISKFLSVLLDASCTKLLPILDCIGARCQCHDSGEIRNGLANSSLARNHQLLQPWYDCW